MTYRYITTTIHQRS